MVDKRIEKAAAAVEALKIDTVKYQDGELVDTYGTPTVIRNEDGVMISAETGDGFLDYYGEPEYGLEDLYIHPRIVEVVEAEGCILEWKDPGTVGIYLD